MFTKCTWIMLRHQIGAVLASLHLCLPSLSRDCAARPLHLSLLRCVCATIYLMADMISPCREFWFGFRQVGPFCCGPDARHAATARARRLLDVNTIERGTYELLGFLLLGLLRHRAPCVRRRACRATNSVVQQQIYRHVSSGARRVVRGTVAQRTFEL
jgi:hypothetical protein